MSVYIFGRWWCRCRPCVRNSYLSTSATNQYEYEDEINDNNNKNDKDDNNENVDDSYVSKSATNQYGNLGLQ